MADATIKGGTQKSDIKVDNLAPNNYLTLVWNNTDTKTKVQTLSVDLDRYNQMNDKLTNSTQNILQSGLYKIINNKYINLGSVAKYFAQTTFDSYGARQAVNGLVNVLQDGAIQNDDVLNALLYYSGDILGDVAREYGVSDINLVVQQLAGQNILNNFNGLDFLDKFCNATQNWTNKSEASLNERMITLPYSQDVVSGEYTGILLGITESDTHSFDIEIPRKRVESGYNYTSHVIVNPFKKDLKLKLTNKVLTSEYNQETEVDNIEAVRDLIESIANSKMRFDIYIRLSNRKYKSYTGLMFSSLSFDKSSSTGMSYDFTCTIEPVDEYIPKTYIFTPPVSSCPVNGNRSTSNNAGRTKSGETNSSQQGSSNGGGGNGGGNNNQDTQSQKVDFKSAVKVFEKDLQTPYIWKFRTGNEVREFTKRLLNRLKVTQKGMYGRLVRGEKISFTDRIILIKEANRVERQMLNESRGQTQWLSRDITWARKKGK